MAQPVGKVPLKESNNQSGGRSGGRAKELPGPTKSPKANPVKGGGIFRATKGNS
jgi:hypothetical protein